MTQRTITLTLTDVGRAALINAAQQSMDVQFTAVSLGSGTVALDNAATALTNLQEQKPIFEAKQLAPGQLRISALFDTDPTTAYTATELGLIGDGVLFGVWSTTDPTQALVVRTPGVPYTATITVGYGQLPSQNISVVIQPLDSAVQMIVSDAINALLAESDPFPQYLNNPRGDARYDPLGSAAAAIAAHDQAADPHPEYLTDARGDARYDPLGSANSALGSLTGFMFPFAGASVPSGFLLANGAAVSRATYAGLFGIIGTTYGAGDGATTFNLPDTRGVGLRGFDNGRGLDPGRALGSYQGDAFAWHGHGVSDPGHAHGIADPGHSHGVNDPGHEHSIRIAVGGGDIGLININGGQLTSENTDAATTGIWLSGSGTGIGVYGSGTGISIQGAGASETRGKNLAVNFVIKY